MRVRDNFSSATPSGEGAENIYPALMVEWKLFFYMNFLTYGGVVSIFSG
jgi:hypothetical protein